MPAGLPPGTVAVTVLITTPAKQYLASVDWDETDSGDLHGPEQTEDGSTAGSTAVQQDGGGIVSQAGGTGADARHLADVADAAAVRDGDEDGNGNGNGNEIGVEANPAVEQVPEDVPARDGHHEEGF